MGYLAEMDGDRETADFYYDKAREADQSSMKVAYASRKDVEGMKLSSVAGDSDDAVNKATEEAAALRRAEGGPVVLRYRNNQPVMEPATPPKPLPENPTRRDAIAATIGRYNRCRTMSNRRQRSRGSSAAPDVDTQCSEWRTARAVAR